MDGHVPVSWSPAPGVRVRWQRDRRYPTANVRVLVHRRVDDEPAKAAVLARTLESACAAWPTRQALAWRLADLYDAALGGWHRIEWSTHAHGSNAVTTERGKRTEVLWSNRPLSEELTLFGDPA